MPTTTLPRDKGPVFDGSAAGCHAVPMPASSDLQDVARDWLDAAWRLGWGVEGPDDAHEVEGAIRSLQEGDAPEHEELLSRLESRQLGTRPVDALHEAASLLLQVGSAPPAARQELLSAARGWLLVATR